MITSVSLLDSCIIKHFLESNILVQGKLVPKVLLENQVYQAKTELTDKTEILVPLENPVSVELPESQEIMVPMDSTA